MTARKGTIDAARRAHWPGARREKLSKTSGHTTEEHSDCWANGHKWPQEELTQRIEYTGFRLSYTGAPALATWLILFSAIMKSLLWLTPTFTIIAPRCDAKTQEE